MSNKLTEIFKDEKLCRKIQKRLPFLFQLAEVESSRAGKIEIDWKKSEIDFNPYARWVEHWEKD